MSDRTSAEARAAVTDLSPFDGRSAILFDLDGTLYGGRDGAALECAIARATGLRIRHLVGVADPLQAYASLQGRVTMAPGAQSKTEVLTNQFQLGIAEMNRFRERHVEPERHVSVDPRLVSMLRALARRFRLALGTNNTPGLARAILDALGVPLACFSIILSSEDVGFAKPDPRFFQRVLADLGLPAAAVVTVGDRPDSDLVPAVRLGFSSWRVARPEDLYALEGLVTEQVAS